MKKIFPLVFLDNIFVKQIILRFLIYVLLLW